MSDDFLSSTVPVNIDTNRPADPDMEAAKLVLFDDNVVMKATLAAAESQTSMATSDPVQELRQRLTQEAEAVAAAQPAPQPTLPDREFLRQFSKREKPEPRITVNIDGADRTFFASFGLVNTLACIVKEVEFVPAISMDPDLRLAVLTALLAERKKGGKLIAEVDPEDVEILPWDAMTLIDWAARHVMDFFLNSTNVATLALVDYQQSLLDLNSLKDGLKG